MTTTIKAMLAVTRLRRRALAACQQQTYDSHTLGVVRAISPRTGPAKYRSSGRAKRTTKRVLRARPQLALM